MDSAEPWTTSIDAESRVRSRAAFTSGACGSTPTTRRAVRRRNPVDGTPPRSRRRRRRVQTSRPGLASRPKWNRRRPARGSPTSYTSGQCQMFGLGIGLERPREEITHAKSEQCVKNQPGDKCRRQERIQSIHDAAVAGKQGSHVLDAEFTLDLRFDQVADGPTTTSTTPSRTPIIEFASRISVTESRLPMTQKMREPARPFPGLLRADGRHHRVLPEQHTGRCNRRCRSTRHRS